MVRWRLPPLLLDAVLAIVVTALVVLGSVGESYPTSPDNTVAGLVVPPWPAYLLAGAAAAVLLWRRRRPVTVWAVSLALVVAYTIPGYVNGAALVAPVLAVYTVTTLGRARRALLLSGITVVVLMGSTMLFGPFGFGGPVTVIPFEVAVALAAGLAVASRRAYVAEIADRAEQAERTREEEARRRVDAERLRIARELHDVVAHTMATISVQAAAAAHVLKDPPPEAATALAAIRAASKDGLVELRAILRLLRTDGEADPRHPTPGLAQLDALAERTRQAGVPVTLRLPAPLPELPGATELVAYRIVQESLTNTVKHAGPARATVTVETRDGQLDLTVVDDGIGCATTESDGHGLLGMRERAASIGGTVEAGPHPGGGFRVHARLPLQAGAPRLPAGPRYPDPLG
ncbi:two-component sensor histidine kinase [Actinocatenispora thailandica]|uniref:histidine kinase n=1 Tax=Actinocatenispora thailandica TaxID=227318 RepID=A0A7R7DJX5_9ACTN|nr:two-component sensor histidine kinase [Actinocatenispora thailandica]